MCAGPLDPQLGWVIDFAEIKTAFKSIEDRIDHRCLNEVGGSRIQPARIWRDGFGRRCCLRFHR